MRRSMLACVSMVFNRVDMSPDSVDVMSATSSAHVGAAQHTVHMMAPMFGLGCLPVRGCRSSCMHVGR